MDKDATHAPDSDSAPPAVSPKTRRPKRRAMAYGLVFLILVLIMPFIALPFVLATIGIHIHGFAGLSLGPTWGVKYVSFTVHDTTITLHDFQIMPPHHVETPSNEQQQTPLDNNTSWQLFADSAHIQLPPSLNQALSPVTTAGLSKETQNGFPDGSPNRPLNGITLKHVSLSLLSLSEPYAFSAHSKQAVLHLAVDAVDDANSASALSSQSTAQNTPHEQQTHRQIFNDFTLVLTTDPHTTLTGSVSNGQFSVFFPQDSQLHSYPIDFEGGQFSVSWENHQTPLAIHLAHITPRWPSVTPNFQQSGHDLTLRMNINQPLATMKVTAKSLALDQPVDLPTFVEKPDEASEGIHLGQTIAHLAQLPLRKLKVERFTYRNLLVNSKIVIETPHFRMNKPDRKARLHIKGQALAPNPYNINVLVKHRDSQLAHVNGAATGPRGNTVSCEGDVRFDSPLPKQLVCKGDIKQTRDITDKFDLTGVPNLRLNAPITFTAKQTQVRYTETSTDLSANKDTHSPPETNHPPETNNTAPLRTLESAKYQLLLSLPKQMTLALPEQEITQPDITVHTDTQLAITAHYHQGMLSLLLDNVPEPVTLSESSHAKETRNTNAKHTGTGNALTVHISQLRCALPVISTQPVIKGSSAPDCQLHADLQGHMNGLQLHPENHLKHLSLQSKVSARWTANTLTTDWQNTRLQIDAIALQPKDSRWVDATARDITITAKRWQATYQGNDKSTRIAAAQSVSVTSSLSAKQLIIGENDSEQAVKALLRTHQKSQLPVQHYTGNVALTFSDTQIDAALPTQAKPFSLSLDSHYQIKLAINQNKQRLPTLHSEGTTHVTQHSVQLGGNLYNKKHIDLLRFDGRYNWQHGEADVTLHRNAIHFSSKQTLKKFYLPHLPVNYDLHAGSLNFDAKVRYRQHAPKAKQWQASFSVFTHDLSGYVNNVHFADLDIALSSEITPQGIRTRQPAGIHIGYLHAGVLLENLYAHLTFDTDRDFYHLYRINAYMLGGAVSVHDVQTNDLLTIPSFPVIVHGLHLTELIDTLEAKDIEMTGIVDGRLPLAFVGGNPVIENGELHARYPGGILKYKEDSAIAQNIEAAGEQNLLVVGKILKNYHYRTLKVHLDYSKEGVMRTKAAFKGHNPDVLSGRPVNVNLSVQENIPALIKTLNMINSAKLEALFLKQMGIDK